LAGNRGIWRALGLALLVGGDDESLEEWRWV